MVKEYKAPEKYKLEEDGRKYIFLAGSIEMGEAENWQDIIVGELKKEDTDAVLLNPRRGSWDSSWEQRIYNEQFNEQVNWEMDGLDTADIIIMYFDPNSKSPISLLELGLHADSGKLIVCCPDGFWRKGNVEIVCERYSIPLVDNIASLIVKVKEKLYE